MPLYIPGEEGSLSCTICNLWLLPLVTCSATAENSSVPSVTTLQTIAGNYLTALQSLVLALLILHMLYVPDHLCSLPLDLSKYSYWNENIYILKLKFKNKVTYFQITKYISNAYNTYQVKTQTLISLVGSLASLFCQVVFSWFNFLN